MIAILAIANLLLNVAVKKVENTSIFSEDGCF